MNRLKIWALIIMIMPLAEISAQSNKQLKGPDYFPELIQPDIPGAPKLGKPVLIMGDKKPVMGEGMGWAAPAVFDWNGDGKKDLLIGEFASGWEMANGNVLGNFIRIYLNKGVDNFPEFYDEFEYARPCIESPPDGTKSNGTPLSVYLWCCMSFRPQFADLNNDGYPDLITGHYYPGDVTWFKGSKQGISTGEYIVQEHRDKHPGYGNKLPVTNPESSSYWNYSSVSFGDFDRDSLVDMVVGGAGLRISKNIGTKTAPKFGLRELLLDINGNPLRIDDSAEEKEGDNENLSVAGSDNTVPLVVDWDKDGILDLMVTDCYLSKNKSTITFFRGVRTKDGHRFEPGVPLFKTKDGGKAFPGSWLQTFVTDWNNDGINDLLIGTSVATIDGPYNYDLSWNWEFETGITKKNPANYSKGYKKKIEEQMERADKNISELGIDDDEARKRNLVTREMLLKNYYGKEEYRTLAHKGYVYLMLGEKQDKPDAISQDTTNIAKEKYRVKKQARIEELDQITEQSPKSGQAEIKGQEEMTGQEKTIKQKQITDQTKVTEQEESGSPVRITATTPLAVNAGEEFTAKILLNIGDSWYIYSPALANAQQGVAQACISFELPEGITIEGKIEWPEPVAKDLFQVYFGKIELSPVFKVQSGTKPGLYKIKVTLKYQGCNQLSCIPQSKEELHIEVNIY
ncbi:MAG: FG-GAP-like repeat-containing protein [Bacteroidales bacterium]|nr:FG-GAP-like repeat-containing protein [Bacteroidales bacterium]